jgi:hypothetical protein
VVRQREEDGARLFAAERVRFNDAALAPGARAMQLTVR